MNPIFSAPEIGVSDLPRGRQGALSSLYWDLYARHRASLTPNPRIGMMYRTWDRMAASERKRILQQADTYRRGLNSL